MTELLKAKKSIEIGARLLREKSPESTMLEHFFLRFAAWDAVADLPQPLQQGKGLYYILERASLPIEEYDLLLGRYDDHVPTPEEQEKLERLQESHKDGCPFEGTWGHTMFDWELIVAEGIAGLLRQTEQNLQTARDEGADPNIILVFEGMLWVHRAVVLYIERYGKAARAAGHLVSAEVCEQLVKGAPRTFHEALQLILFVYTIYLAHIGTTNCCLTLGRLDNTLLSLYENDLNSGALTEELAGALIDDFSAKLSLHLGRGEHQMAELQADYIFTGWQRNPVYDSPAYILLGGYSNTRNHKENPLTLLFAKHIHPELKNPIYICRYTGDRHDELWNILCEKMQQNASLILYNDETMIPAQRHIGIEEHNAINYSVYPCNWPEIDGGYSIFDQCCDSMPTILNRTLKARSDYANMDELFAEVDRTFTGQLRPTFEAYRAQYCSGEVAPDGMLGIKDCFMGGTIRSGRRMANGAAKYPAVYVRLRHIGTATDMLCAIDTLVFQKKICTLPQLLEAAERNFEGAEDLLHYCRKAPKYGTGDRLADEHACRLMNTLLDAVDREATNERGQRDIYTLNAGNADMFHIRVGSRMGATVDGRLAGEPLSEHFSPTVGYQKSVTSMLNSVAKLPFDRIHSGVLNLRLSRSMVAGEEGKMRLKALIESYFDQGGMQLQISVADTEELRHAKEHPEQHKDLLVRITGYSAVFVDLCQRGQDEIIRREEVR
ncbi:MAG: hypothetical protein IJA11_01285 [Oscillospiraceae bacterium]|nr:hypothetical protein [Oscillospiraceae bacterium]